MKYFKMQWNSVCEGNPETIRDYFRTQLDRVEIVGSQGCNGVYSWWRVRCPFPPFGFNFFMDRGKYNRTTTRCLYFKLEIEDIRTKKKNSVGFQGRVREFLRGTLYYTGVQAVRLPIEGKERGTDGSAFRAVTERRGKGDDWTW